MRRSIDNGLLPANTQQDNDKRLEINDRSLGHRRHSDVVDGSKSDLSSMVPKASAGGGRSLSTPPLPPNAPSHTGHAWDISSLISSQTGNTGGTGQDTGLGSLMYSMTTSGTNSHSNSTVPPVSSDKQSSSYHPSQFSDSSRTSSTTQLNLSR